jgi:hypothetical protein
VSADYVVLITDRNMQVVGDPIVAWTAIDVTLKFNEAGSGFFTAPGYDWIRDQVRPGCRAAVLRNGIPLIAGPVEQWLWERSDDGDNAGAGQLTVNFADFMGLISARLTYPDGALTPGAQTLDSWSYTGNAELALRELVSKNAGPTALADRVIPRLALGTVAGVGSSATFTSDRMEPLADVMRRVASAGGNLGFRTRWDEATGLILFEVYQSPDLSQEAVFGFGYGSLKYVAFEQTAPKANTAIVGGQGDGADRLLLERDNLASAQAWDRYETLVSRPGNDPTADLQTDGDAALAEGAETVRVPASASDTPFLSYGDYDVGSIVSVETWPGNMIADVVTTVHFQVYPTSGEYVSPTVGSQAATSDPKWLQSIRAMARRMSYLERHVLPTAL